MGNAPRPSGPGRSRLPSHGDGESGGEGDIARPGAIRAQDITGSPIRVRLVGPGESDSSSKRASAMTPRISVRQLTKALLSTRKQLDRKVPEHIVAANGGKRRKNGKRGVPATEPDENGFEEDLDFRPRLVLEKDYSDYLIRPKLITAMVSYADSELILHAFHASVTTSLYTIREHLVSRYGEEAMGNADIRYGYHAGHPLVIALVPDPIAEVILRMQAEETQPAREGFVVDIEHRIQT